MRGSRFRELTGEKVEVFHFEGSTGKWFGELGKSVVGRSSAIVIANPGERQMRGEWSRIQLDPESGPPATTLADAAPLIGHWRGDFLGGTGEEVWLPPAGGAMVGTFRLIRDDAVVFYELMTIVEEEGGVVLHIKHFGADLAGWEEKEETVPSKLLKAEPDALYFEGLTFKFLPDGSLKGYLAMGPEGGDMTEAVIDYRRVEGE